MSEPERYFLISEFEDGWGMDDVDSEEQLYYYCTEALYIPEEKIEELNFDDSYNLEISLQDLQVDDLFEDWYVNLVKISKESQRYPL